MQNNEIIAYINDNVPTIEFLQKYWEKFPFNEWFFNKKFLEWIKNFITPNGFLFSGNYYSNDFDLQNVEIDEYIKWHCNGEMNGYWKIYCGDNAKLSLRGIKNRVNCHNACFIEDRGNGSIISVKDNSCIISYQKYNDNSRFWQYINSSESADLGGLYKTRPEWTQHFPLTIKMGSNSAITVNVKDKFYTWKSGIDLIEDQFYTFHVGNVCWNKK